MVRLVRLIRTSGGQINAVLIINVEVKSLLGSTVPAMRNGVRLLALTSDLDYFLIDEDAAADSVVLHTEERWQRLPEMEAASFSDQFVSIDQGEEALAMPILALEERENRPFSIQTISSIDRAYITEQLRLRFFWIGVFLLLSLFLSWFLAQRFAENILAPLKKLHQRIIDRPDQGLPIEIEISSGDEVGELAAAFQEMSESLVAETLRVRAMFSAVDNAIVVIDQDGIIEEFNPAASQIFGYEAQEIVGKKLETLMPKSDAENHQGYVRNFDGQSRIMSEQRNITGVRKDGSHVYLEISVNKVTYAGKDHVIGLARDVSQRVKAQNKVETLISALKRSNEELDQFAYMASHDLRAPLRVIENASKWLEEDLEEHLTEETREILDLLKSRASRMDKMLQDLLEHSRIGKSDIDTQNIRGDELMSGIMQLLDVPAGCKIHVSDAFKGVQIPQMPIETVLLNLISNAIKHHDHDECEINVDVIDRGDVFEFSIQDDGPGIPVQFQEKVFEIFHTLKPRDEVESSGMGLAMVRKHVDVIGGTIDLISDGVRGTTFRISWPKRRPQSDHGLSLKAS
ncbi:hypothetical protein SAMN04488093_102162 [Tropicibacter naphthalenivorans]|uniref:histidine kinase n=2 Tax=Tropicibacter naphthalenivorans TaxID=441103 RepID=A0A0P1G6N8_9RHOB|nr:Sensor protein FixL [Tropicibacter naphthalenivorans]SMC58295.1 hypothetical protein SAMN04488093_102162 [Tropicibacter naphthalenivorans]